MFIHENDPAPDADDAESDWFDRPWFLAVCAVVLVATCIASATFPLPWFGG
jgi:hypothetical protein